MIYSVSKSVSGRWFKAICLCLFLLPGAAKAADDIAESLGLPESRHLAAALADPESRVDTLLTLIAVQRLMDYGRYARPHQVAVGVVHRRPAHAKQQEGEHEAEAVAVVG